MKSGSQAGRQRSWGSLTSVVALSRNATQIAVYRCLLIRVYWQLAIRNAVGCHCCWFLRYLVIFAAAWRLSALTLALLTISMSRQQLLSLSFLGCCKDLFLVFYIVVVAFVTRNFFCHCSFSADSIKFVFVVYWSFLIGFVSLVCVIFLF